MPKFSKLFSVLSFCLYLVMGCSSGNIREPAIADGFVIVESSGNDLDEAVRNAKLSMIDTVLGEWIESESILMDFGSRSFLIQSSREGFVRDFKILEQPESKPLIKIRASGYVNKKAAGNALEERYKLLGKPRILVFVSEKIGNSSALFGGTLTETKLMSLLSGFEIADSNSIRKKNKISKANIELDAAKELAKKENCELLFFGSFESREGGKLVEGSDMKAVFANFQYKLVETESSRVLVSDTLSGGKPSIDLQYGSEKAREQILSELVPLLRKKLAEEWKRGYSIQVEIDHLSYDTYVDSDLINRIRSLKGVNSVIERGKDQTGKIRLEVAALFNGAKLYSILREFQQDVGLSFSGKEVTGNLLRIDAEPLNGNIRK